jgi:hypothetical protein
MNTASCPTKIILWRGVILHAIVNATMIAENSDFARFLSWDGKNYVLNGADGTYGAITFDGDVVVAVFFDVRSAYSPYRSCKEYDINRFLTGMPARHRRIAEECTLQYNRQNYQGALVPLVTAAFWNEGEYLTAAFPWEEVVKNGAHIIRVELIPDAESALQEWQDAYQMSAAQVSFARSLFERKMIQPNEVIELGQTEVEWLRSTAEGPEAMEHCDRAFATIGIRKEKGSGKKRGHS